MPFSVPTRPLDLGDGTFVEQDFQTERAPDTLGRRGQHIVDERIFPLIDDHPAYRRRADLPPDR
jgi:hypothetical protein